MAMRQTASSAIPQRLSSTGKCVRSGILSFSERCQNRHHNAVQPRLPCYGPKRSAVETACYGSSLSGGLAHGEQLGYHPDYNGANLEAKMQRFLGISRSKAR